jgi:dolichol-phosphate mannosyltransferase
MHPIPDVTVVVPCFNEEDGLPTLLARLRAMRTGRASNWQFLFIDDGSTDDTFAALLRAARDEPSVSVLRHHENRGLGAALRTAFATPPRRSSARSTATVPIRPNGCPSSPH